MIFLLRSRRKKSIDSAGEDGKEAGPVAGALPARAVRPLDAVIFVPMLIVMPAVRWMPWKKDL